MKSQIKIITVNYNNWPLTSKLLDSIFVHTSSNNVQVIVVNNGEINAPEIISKQVTVIKSSKNLGYGGALNLALSTLKASKDDYVFIINNDCQIQSDYFFEKLITSKTDLTSPLIYDQVGGGRRYDCGGKIDRIFGRHTHSHSNLKPSQIIYPDYISGVAMIAKKTVFDKVGLFDDKFFMYFEDVDWCLRAKRNGFSMSIQVESILSHELSVSSSSKSKLSMLIKSHRYFTQKYSHLINPLGSFVYNAYLKLKLLI